MTVGEKDKERGKEVRGTREWAVAEINCCHGCPHGCKYCYARYDMVERHRILTQEEWPLCKTVDEDVLRRHPLYSGQVMFPTAHDIVPTNLAASVEQMLDTGDVVTMAYELLPFVSHSIWLGKMNEIDERVVIDSATMGLAVQMLKRGQEDIKILKIYRELSGIPQVRWKDSIKQVMGLTPVEKPGLDI